MRYTALIKDQENSISGTLTLETDNDPAEILEPLFETMYRQLISSEPIAIVPINKL